MNSSKLGIKLLMAATLALCFWIPRTASSAPSSLFRLDAEFLGSNEGGEISTTVPALSGGTAIFTKALFIPPAATTLYITFSGQGDGHNGVALQLECLLDGVACSPDFGGVSADAPAGWITPLKHYNYQTTYLLPDGVTIASAGDGGGGTGDLHDNSINHTWCVPVTGGAVHTISINLGNSCGEILTPTCATTVDTTVFLENLHFYTDATKGTTLCTAY